MSNFKVQDPDRFTVDDLFEMSPRTMNAVIHAMSEEHRHSLLDYCKAKIEQALDIVCMTGHEACDSRGITRYPNQYTVAKKYTYMYENLSGWAFESDLKAREEKQFEDQGGLTPEQIEAFKQKGWVK